MASTDRMTLLELLRKCGVDGVLLCCDIVRV